VVTLLGRNGAGKTTTLKSVMGIIGKHRFDPLQQSRHHARFLRQDRADGHRLLPRGARHIRKPRRARKSLPPIVRAGGLSLDQIFDLFPNLKERLNSQGTKLSGGEQQMLAIARSSHRRALPDAG
jgi:branched-chain amino acid transport system ATP-binding protein